MGGKLSRDAQRDARHVQRGRKKPRGVGSLLDGDAREEVLKRARAFREEASSLLDGAEGLRPFKDSLARLVAEASIFYDEKAGTITDLGDEGRALLNAIASLPAEQQGRAAAALTELLLFSRVSGRSAFAVPFLSTLMSELKDIPDAVVPALVSAKYYLTYSPVGSREEGKEGARVLSSFFRTIFSQDMGKEERDKILSSLIQYSPYHRWRPFFLEVVGSFVGKVERSVFNALLEKLSYQMDSDWVSEVEKELGAEGFSQFLVGVLAPLEVWKEEGMEYAFAILSSMDGEKLHELFHNPSAMDVFKSYVKDLRYYLLPTEKVVEKVKAAPWEELLFSPFADEDLILDVILAVPKEAVRDALEELKGLGELAHDEQFIRLFIKALERAPPGKIKEVVEELKGLGELIRDEKFANLLVRVLEVVPAWAVGEAIREVKGLRELAHDGEFARFLLNVLKSLPKEEAIEALKEVREWYGVVKSIPGELREEIWEKVKALAGNVRILGVMMETLREVAGEEELLREVITCWEHIEDLPEKDRLTALKGVAHFFLFPPEIKKEVRKYVTAFLEKASQEYVDTYNYILTHGFLTPYELRQEQLKRIDVSVSPYFGALELIRSLYEHKGWRVENVRAALDLLTTFIRGGWDIGEHAKEAYSAIHFIARLRQDSTLLALIWQALRRPKDFHIHLVLAGMAGLMEDGKKVGFDFEGYVEGLKNRGILEDEVERFSLLVLLVRYGVEESTVFGPPRGMLAHYPIHESKRLVELLERYPPFHLLTIEDLVLSLRSVKGLPEDKVEALAEGLAARIVPLVKAKDLSAEGKYDIVYLLKGLLPSYLSPERSAEEVEQKALELLDKLEPFVSHMEEVIPDPSIRFEWLAFPVESYPFFFHPLAISTTINLVREAKTEKAVQRLLKKLSIVVESYPERYLKNLSEEEVREILKKGLTYAMWEYVKEKGMEELKRREERLVSLVRRVSLPKALEEVDYDLLYFRLVFSERTSLTLWGFRHYLGQALEEIEERSIRPSERVRVVGKKEVALSPKEKERLEELRGKYLSYLNGAVKEAGKGRGFSPSVGLVSIYTMAYEKDRSFMDTLRKRVERPSDYDDLREALEALTTTVIEEVVLSWRNWIKEEVWKQFKGWVEKELSEAGVGIEFNTLEELEEKLKKELDRLSRSKGLHGLRKKRAAVGRVLGYINLRSYEAFKDYQFLRSLREKHKETGGEVEIELMFSHSPLDIIAGFISSDSTAGKIDYLYPHFKEGKGIVVKVMHDGKWKGNIYVVRGDDYLMIDALQWPFCPVDEGDLWEKVVEVFSNWAREEGKKLFVSSFLSNYPNIREGFAHLADKYREVDPPDDIPEAFESARKKAYLIVG